MFRTLQSALLCLLLCSASPITHALPDDAIEVAITIEGDEVHLDISTLVDAKSSEVWAVLTDFDHMAEFISNLKFSRVIARDGPNHLTVEQHGRAGSGPISFAIDSIRDIQLKPFEWIRSRLVSGSMKKFEGQMRLSEENGKTRLQYHSDAISGMWIPPVVGKNLIATEAREQFAELLHEITRRKAGNISR